MTTYGGSLLTSLILLRHIIERATRHIIIKM